MGTFKATLDGAVDTVDKLDYYYEDLNSSLGGSSSSPLIYFLDLAQKYAFTSYRISIIDNGYRLIPRLTEFVSITD